MTEMQDRDSILLFTESLKKAASCARQLANITKNKSWTSVAIGFEAMRSKGEVMYSRPAPSRSEILTMVDGMVGKQAKEPSDKIN